MTPARVLALLATAQSVDIVLPTTEGREIRLRQVTALPPEQKFVLALFGIKLPERLDFDLECGVNSATGY
jgi:hypothetical protein